MTNLTAKNLTDRQQKWFASVQASLERDTGKTLAEWVEIVKTQCPETKPRARSVWLKENYGLGVNRAAQILDAAYPSADAWDEPDALRAALWTDPAATAILNAVEAAVADFDGLVPTQRKGFSAFSRKVQFAAVRPIKGGDVWLGLAIAPDADARLEPAGKEGWSERLTSKIRLSHPDDVDSAITAWLRVAYERS
ncbi:DUF4287 domain-containing protein [Asticcacaulis sp. BYS171W]|uniref:DUF4287 domain-containing protein n=1 Tax=Asticcacaulis aquaticus TaxID=2984212 RepID=A0ABT5HTW3_9CAUL|nr:DUF4287 domain-containing protein [Asticcacaulis aquaticus]MDC7683507.1 DUF4287 domain-containing protein [Asticcacaulis aquaticus]